MDRSTATSLSPCESSAPAITCSLSPLASSNDALIAEYRYNGLGFRITETFDTDTDGDVDGNDVTYHFAYDERWRIIATYVNDDAAADPKELFVHHAAGAGGYGSSSYIDAVILRDVDLSEDWDEPVDALDTRHYYCQNWRADVSVIIDDAGVIVERVMYSPYGVPFGIPAGDLVTSSSLAEPADGTVDGADQAYLIGQWGAGWDTADLDNDGSVGGFDLALLTGNWGDNLGWGAMSLDHNRLGYAGYVFDEALAGTKWHVRHRVLESVLGRWISRDPIGFLGGVNLYQYSMTNPVVFADPSGLAPPLPWIPPSWTPRLVPAPPVAPMAPAAGPLLVPVVVGGLVVYCVVQGAAWVCYVATHPTVPVVFPPEICNTSTMRCHAGNPYHPNAFGDPWSMPQPEPPGLLDPLLYPPPVPYVGPCPVPLPRPEPDGGDRERQRKRCQDKYLTCLRTRLADFDYGNRCYICRDRCIANGGEWPSDDDCDFDKYPIH